MDLQGVINIYKENIDDTRARQEHKQLAEWLEELLFRRNNELYNLGEYFEINNFPFVITHVKDNGCDIVYTLNKIELEKNNKEPTCVDCVNYVGSILKSFKKISKEEVKEILRKMEISHIEEILREAGIEIYDFDGGYRPFYEVMISIAIYFEYLETYESETEEKNKKDTILEAICGSRYKKQFTREG